MTVLFVFATILLFLSIEWVVRKMRDQRAVPAAAPTRPFAVRVPGGVFFAPSHTWLNIFPSGRISIGIDDFVSQLFERPEVVLLKTAGDKFRKGEPLLLLRQDAHVLTVHSPLDGEVLVVNEELPRKPDLIKEQLFNSGWSYVVKPTQLAEIKRLFVGEETRTWMREEFRRLRDFFARMNSGSTVPAFLQDGGPPLASAMENMDDDVWKQFQYEFLQPR